MNRKFIELNKDIEAKIRQCYRDDLIYLRNQLAEDDNTSLKKIADISNIDLVEVPLIDTYPTETTCGINTMIKYREYYIPIGNNIFLRFLNRNKFDVLDLYSRDNKDILFSFKKLVLLHEPIDINNIISIHSMFANMDPGDYVSWMSSVYQYIKEHGVNHVLINDLDEEFFIDYINMKSLSDKNIF